MNDKQPRLPPDRLWQPTTAKWFVVVFGGSLAYAVIRYHFAGNVAWQHFPLFILNKATSLAAVIFVACSYLTEKSSAGTTTTGLCGWWSSSSAA